MNKLSSKERATILHLLCEGNSIRSIVRVTGASKNTISKLLIDAGKALGARNLLCVSSEPDITDTKKRFEAICRRAEDTDMRVVIEFLMITEVRSLQQALEIVTDVAHPAGANPLDDRPATTGANQ